MVFCILHVESPDIEFGFSLPVNQCVALRRDRWPLCVADWTSDWLRDATSGRDSPQTRRYTSIGGENDFTAVGGPGWRAHDGPVVKSQALRRPPTRGRHHVNIVTDASYRRTYKSYLSSVGRKCRLVIEPARRR